MQTPAYSVQRRNGAAVITLTGHVDALNFADLAAVIRRAMTETTPRLLLDCHRVTAMGSAQLRHLAELAFTARQQGGDLLCVGLPPAIAEVGNLVCTKQPLRFCPDVASAFGAFSGQAAPVDLVSAVVEDDAVPNPRPRTKLNHQSPRSSTGGSSPSTPTDTRRLVKAVASVAVIIGALFYISARSRRPSSTFEINAGIHQTVGQVAAAETTRLIGDRGTIAVVTVDAPPGNMATLDSIADGFTADLKSHPNVMVVATERVAMADVLQSATLEFGMPPTVFYRLLENNPPPDAIVSFVGAPKLTDAQLARLPGRLPKVIVVDGFGYHSLRLKGCLKKNLVQFAIVPNPGIIPPLDSRRRDAKEWFTLTYATVTPATADILP